VRLNLYWRGRDVIDIELHAWRKRPDQTTTDDGPRLEASGGGSSERSSTFGDPATIAGFGFQSQGWRAPRDGGYHPALSLPEPMTPPQGGAGHSDGSRKAS